MAPTQRARNRLDLIVLGEIRFGILLLHKGRRRARNRADFEKAGVEIIDPFAG